ncbi:T-cell activation Rho GTPase-activating protein-like [Pogoniulus pusillus]|uniref:T-cell activation Rho GTPase-activating protein-like n=1 Tax=Pogoniulus pusillus TaxID=488313 RepID=UPI0030B93EB8
MPQPIQDLLALLHQRGPSTEGIFRLAAGERDLGALREALDSGQEVPLQSQPVHLLAATLKDFLRKIPSKLLEAELYQQWMGALHKSSRQARLAALKEVTNKLPQANLILLKSLLSLLHNISSNTDSSRMTARSLAICVGPNLLSPVEEPPLDMLLEVTSRVTELVELLIEMQGELFAEEQVPGSDGPSAEEEPGTTEVCESTNTMTTKASTLKGGTAATGTTRLICQPTALQKCRVRLMPDGHHTLGGDLDRSELS